MVTTQEILTKIRAAENKAPTGAFATEIESNASIEGNLNSKHLYNQTPEKDNGLQKMAENKYLEKIAAFKWVKDLVKNVKDADPLTHVGVGSSMAGLGLSAGKYKVDKNNNRSNVEKIKLEEESLKALKGINKTLNKAVIAPKLEKVAGVVEKSSVIKMDALLEKVAEKNESNFHPGKALGSAIVGSVASLPFTVGQSVAGIGLLNEMDKKTGHSDMGTVRKMMRDNKLNVTFNHRNHINKDIYGDGKGFLKDQARQLKHHLDAGGAGPAYMHSQSLGGRKNYISGVKVMNLKTHGMTMDLTKKRSMKNVDIIMHELGHAKDYQKHGGAKMIARVAGTKLGPLATLAALSHDKTRDYAVPIAALSTIPTLRDEGAANYHAYKGVKSHKGAAAANTFLRKTVSKNMLNYGFGAAGVVAGTYGAKKIMDKWSPRKGVK